MNKIKQTAEDIIAIIIVAIIKAFRWVGLLFSTLYYCETVRMLIATLIISGLFIPVVSFILTIGKLFGFN